MRLCCLFGFAAGVDLLLNIPDLTSFNSLVDDALSLFGVELGVVAKWTIYLTDLLAVGMKMSSGLGDSLM